MSKLWKLQVLEPRRTDNSALMKAIYCGGDSFFEFRSVATLTPEGRKQFADLCDEKLKSHMKSIAVVDEALVKELEDEMNGKPFAIDEMNKKNAEAEQKENDRKGKIEAELDKKRKELEDKDAGAADGDKGPSYSDTSEAEKIEAEKVEAEKKTTTTTKAPGSGKFSGSKK